MSDPIGFENNPRLLKALEEHATREDDGKDSVSTQGSTLFVAEERDNNPTRNTSIQQVAIGEDYAALYDYQRRYNREGTEIGLEMNSVCAYSDGRIVVRTGDDGTEHDVTTAAAALGITAASLNNVAIDTAWNGEVERHEQQYFIDTYRTLSALVPANERGGRE